MRGILRQATSTCDSYYLPPTPRGNPVVNHNHCLPRFSPTPLARAAAVIRSDQEVTPIVAAPTLGCAPATATAATMPAGSFACTDGDRVYRATLGGYQMRTAGYISH